MYCIECGEELPDEAKFCFSCGEKTEIVDAITNQGKSEKKLNKKVIIDENLDDEIIEIKKGSIKLVSPIDEIKKNMKGNVKKNRDYIKLRKTYKKLSGDDIEKMISKKKFFEFNRHKDAFEFYRNKSGDFANDYNCEIFNGDVVIVDKATNLMWHQSGSEYIEYSEIKTWVKLLNKWDKYAGFSNWRLPTLEESLSISENFSGDEKDFNSNRIFSKNQTWIYTGDFLSSELVWVCNVIKGTAFPSNINKKFCVRPVRSIKDV